MIPKKKVKKRKVKSHNKPRIKILKMTLQIKDQKVGEVAKNQRTAKVRLNLHKLKMKKKKKRKNEIRQEKVKNKKSHKKILICQIQLRILI